MKESEWKRIKENPRRHKKGTDRCERIENYLRSIFTFHSFLFISQPFNARIRSVQFSGVYAKQFERDDCAKNKILDA